MNAEIAELRCRIERLEACLPQAVPDVRRFMPLPTRILLVCAEHAVPLTNQEIHRVLGGDTKLTTVASTVSRLVAKGQLTRYSYRHVSAVKPQGIAP